MSMYLQKEIVQLAQLENVPRIKVQQYFFDATYAKRAAAFRMKSHYVTTSGSAIFLALYSPEYISRRYESR